MHACHTQTTLPGLYAVLVPDKLYTYSHSPAVATFTTWSVYAECPPLLKLLILCSYDKEHA